MIYCFGNEIFKFDFNQAQRKLIPNCLRSSAPGVLANDFMRSLAPLTVTEVLAFPNPSVVEVMV